MPQWRGIYGSLGIPLYRSQDYAVRALEGYESFLDELHSFVYVPRQDWDSATASFDKTQGRFLSTIAKWLHTALGATFSLTQP